MKIIEQSHEILRHDDLLKIIEDADRAYYKSEPENTVPTQGCAKNFDKSNMSTKEKLVHTTRTIRFITSHSVVHEMIRQTHLDCFHNVVQYVKDGETMEFILPVWCSRNIVCEFNDTDEIEFVATNAAEKYFLNSLFDYAETYDTMTDVFGWTPEQAMELLPNAIKTEIIYTATLGEWTRILKQHTSPAAHPQIRALMTPVLDQFKQELPEIFVAEK